MKKYLIVVSLFVLACSHCFCASDTINLKRHVKQMFKDLIENPNFDETLVDKYVSEDYVQMVDGKTFYYPEFKSHLKVIKEAATPGKVQFLHIVSDKNKVATVHHVHEVKKNGEPLITEVIALFQFDKNNKMVLCRELTHIVQGNEEDKELSSKH